MTRKQCCVRVYRENWPRNCANPGKVNVNGKYYCCLHDPVKVKAQTAKRDAEMHVAFERRMAEGRRDKAIRALGEEALAAMTGPTATHEPDTLAEHEAVNATLSLEVLLERQRG